MLHTQFTDRWSVTPAQWEGEQALIKNLGLALFFFFFFPVVWKYHKFEWFMGSEMKASCWLTKTKFSPEVPRTIRWLLDSRAELSSQREVWPEVLQGSRYHRSGSNRQFCSNIPICPTWLIPYDKGQQCRFHWFPGHAVTSGALPAACSNAHSLSGGTRFSRTATPCRRASRSSQSSESASEPPKSRVEKHALSTKRYCDFTHKMQVIPAFTWLTKFEPSTLTWVP